VARFSQVKISQSQASDNMAEAAGGALFTVSSNAVIVSDSKFENNRASTQGGAASLQATTASPNVVQCIECLFRFVKHSSCSLSLCLSLSFVLLIDEMRMVNVIGRSPSLFPVFVCVLMRLTETTRVLEAEECTSSSRTCLSTSQQSTTTPRRTACLSLRHLIVMENSATTEQSSNH